MADGMEQIMKSPAYVFKQRVEDIDCKTYSIFACLFANMGIIHFIRQIKQPSSRLALKLRNTLCNELNIHLYNTTWEM